MRFDPADAIFPPGISQEDRSLSYIDTAASAAPAATQDAPGYDGAAVLELVLHALDADKAEDIVTIDLQGRSVMADQMVIASGRSSRQVGALAQKLLDRLKERFRISARAEGRDTGDWVLIDAGDVVVHIFRPEVRAFYQLEKMWGAAAPADRPQG